MNGAPSFYFGQDAEGYRAFRPQYPTALYEWLARAAPSRGLAWDCGTGSGQAAVGLAGCFERVVATDPDPRQLAMAPKRANIDYRLAAAEADLGLAGRVDLIACACSVHWFDLPAFYARAREALKPDGIIAVWTYDWPLTGSAPLDAALETLKNDILGPFWGENARYYFSGYAALPFPFEERPAPLFHSPIAASCEELMNFLSTWSAVRKYRARHGRDPLARIGMQVAHAWKASPPVSPVSVPLHMRCGSL
ncbi:class I SAM-dependent methyltransferase [Methylocystis sp. JAN1]|uniref:class I SAM-dependent methyltransferase n=1 Tax=Methylocystis sp. JAN1 TaxID=3397211 RepID=UPI003FA340D6